MVDVVSHHLHSGLAPRDLAVPIVKSRRGALALPRIMKVESWPSAFHSSQFLTVNCHAPKRETISTHHDILNLATIDAYGIQRVHWLGDY